MTKLLEKLDVLAIEALKLVPDQRALQTHIAELRALARSATADAAGWIRCDERNPADGQGVLLYGMYASGEDPFWLPCSWPPDIGDALGDVTHWMPLTEPSNDD